MKYLPLILLLAVSPAQAGDDDPIFFEQVYTMLVDAHFCLSCHSGKSGSAAMGLDLDFERAYEQLVGFPSMQSAFTRVEPGDPEASFLFKKLRGDDDIQGFQMPLGGPFLEEEELELVAEWIRQGALKEED